MPALIGFVLLAVAALIVVSVAVHFLFSPFVLIAVIALVAWIKFRPSGSRR